MEKTSVGLSRRLGVLGIVASTVVLVGWQDRGDYRRLGTAVGDFFTAEVPRIGRALEMPQAVEGGFEDLAGNSLHADRPGSTTLEPSQFSLTIYGIVGVEIPSAANLQLQPSLTLNWVTHGLRVPPPRFPRPER